MENRRTNVENRRTNVGDFFVTHCSTKYYKPNFLRIINIIIIIIIMMREKMLLGIFLSTKKEKNISDSAW